MKLSRFVLLLLLLPFVSRSQSPALNELSLPGEPSNNLLYKAININGGWASTGRAVKENGEAYGIVTIFRNDSAQVFSLKAGVQCRFYSLISDSDSTILTTGYIRYATEAPQRAFLARWQLDGQLLDSSSCTIEDKTWLMVNDLELGSDKMIYALCMVRENDISHPWLLQFDRHLVLQQYNLLPGQSVDNGIQGKIIKGYKENSFFYCINDKDSCLLACINNDGSIVNKKKVEVPNENNYFRTATDSAEIEYGILPEIFDLNYRNGRLYISGTVRSRSWLGWFDDSLLLHASCITEGSFAENGGTLFFSGNQVTLSSLISYPGMRAMILLYTMDDSSLNIRNLLYTTDPCRMSFGTTLPDGRLLLTGAVLHGESETAAYGIVQLSPEKTIAAPKAKWSSLDGPPGADATAFNIDKKGDYWLGTGSSGGVYYSSNKGQSWQPKLDGLGPMHVNGISWRNDTLFARVSDMRLIENKLVDPRDKEVFFFLKKGKGAWKYYKERDKYYGLHRYIQEENILKFNDYNEQFPLQKTEREYSRLMQYYKGWGVDFKNEGFDLYTHEVSNRFGGFYALDSTLVNLNQHFPADVFEGERNIERDGDRLILLAKSGLYFSEKGGALQPAPVKGLIATDVRLLREGPNGDLYALVGTHEIWKQQNKEWILWFDGNDHLREYGKDTVVTGYDIPLFDVNTNGEVAFPFGGDAWMVSGDGKPSLLKPHGEYLNDNSGKPGNVNIFGAAITSDGRKFILGVGGTDSFVLLEEAGTELKPVIDTKTMQFCYLYTDKVGKTWFVGDSIYRLDLNGPRAFLERPNGMAFITNISSNHKGKLVLMNSGGCLLFDPLKENWQAINLATPLIEGSEQRQSFNSVAIDDSDRIYTGTAPYYTVSCGFGTEGYPSGVFLNQGYYMSSLKNSINNWILSVECDKEGRVLAGTAGSGVIATK